jgi:hypothetical protein
MAAPKRKPASKELVVRDKRAKNGGPRPNSGRKEGSTTLLTRKTAQEICDSGESPLHLMHENMLFWWKAATSLGERLNEIILGAEDDPETALDPEARAEAVKVLANFLAARDRAQACAVDAAPYCHPRLQAIQLKGKIEGEVRAILGPMTPQQAAEAYQEMIR